MQVDASWENVKTVLRQQFSLIPMVTLAAMQWMHRYQQKTESLQEFSFEFSKSIQAVTNWGPKYITDPLKYTCIHRSYLIPQLALKLFDTYSILYRKL